MFSILKVLLVLLAASGVATAGHVFYNASSSPSTNWKVVASMALRDRSLARDFLSSQSAMVSTGW